MSAYSDAVNALSPTGYWRLGETGGTTAVAEVGPNGTIQDVGGGTGPTPTSGLLTGDADGAQAWADAGDEIAFADNAAFNSAAISVVAWIHPTSWNGDNRVFQKGASDDQWDLKRDSGSNTLRFTIRGDVNDHAAIATPATGSTYMLAGTYAKNPADGFIRLYVDGVEASNNGLALFFDITPVATGAAIGNKPGANFNGDQFIGTIDEVAVFDYVLSALEIADLYEVGTAEPSEPIPVLLLGGL